MRLLGYIWNLFSRKDDFDNQTLTQREVKVAIAIGYCINTTRVKWIAIRQVTRRGIWNTFYQISIKLARRIISPASLDSLTPRHRMECNLSCFVSITLGRVPQVPTIYWCAYAGVTSKVLGVSIEVHICFGAMFELLDLYGFMVVMPLHVCVKLYWVLMLARSLDDSFRGLSYPSCKIKLTEWRSVCSSQPN
jgi:hypothetical protein